MPDKPSVGTKPRISCTLFAGFRLRRPACGTCRRGLQAVDFFFELLILRRLKGIALCFGFLPRGKIAFLNFNIGFIDGERVVGADIQQCTVMRY